jgi:hypothetical protein
MSTAFHPQLDGQRERANRTLEEMRRSYISYHQRDWGKFLSMMEFTYNNPINQTTGISPFLLNQGFHPLVPASLITPTTTSAPAVADFIQQQSSVLALAQDAIAQAQLQQKHYVDKFHQPVSFAVGDMVLLSTEHISAAAHTNKPSKKLKPNFVGPFKIVFLIEYERLIRIILFQLNFEFDEKD